jgi:hypothetical protein
MLLGILLFPAWAFGKNAATTHSTDESPLTYYLTLYSGTDQREVSQRAVLEFVSRLEHKRESFASDKEFIRYVFRKAQKNFLNSFTEYSSFADLLNKGEYNCLTGTALYAVLLQHFDISYQIIETNYHIFLMAETQGGDVLVEATDPINGFVDSPAEIEKRISTYRRNAIQTNGGSKNFYRFRFDLYEEVTLDQMLGLLYYNQAIKAYNNHHWVEAVSALDKAFALYQSPRMEEFSKVMMLSVVDSKMETSLKENCIRKIQLMRKRKGELVASINRSW